jgi:hypothetical protein
MPVYEWRPPDRFTPGAPREGQLTPIADIQRVHADAKLPRGAAAPEVLAAAGKAIATAEQARMYAEARCEDAVRAAGRARSSADSARAKLRELQNEHQQLSADAGYLLRHILDCRRHYVSKRIEILTRRYKEQLRTDVMALPGGEIVTVTPSGTGWPGTGTSR